MLSFTSSLSPSSEGFVIFATENYHYKDKKSILSKDTVKKINSFLSVLKDKKKDGDISSFDISEKQKCFIIKVKNKYESYGPEESGGSFFSYLKQFKDIRTVTLYTDSLDFNREKLENFFSEFIFGFNLKSYTFNKYKTLKQEKIDKKINLEIITSNK